MNMEEFLEVIPDANDMNEFFVLDLKFVHGKVFGLLIDEKAQSDRAIDLLLPDQQID